MPQLNSPSGAHTIRYYGFYSNKSRGMRVKSADFAEEDTLQRKLSRFRWAALIKRVYEVDPLICPHYGQEMRILKHCNLWVEPVPEARRHSLLSQNISPWTSF
jgi:hypothetical protein